MAEQTSSSITVNAPADRVMAVIADFASYPDWAHGVKRAEVLSETPDGRAEKVHFTLDAAPIKDTYTLAYVWNGDTSVRWKLTQGVMMKAMDGSYELRGDGSTTEVTYRLTVEVAIPMIGMLRRKAEKVVIDTALKGLKKRVESLG
ncbi:MAG: SRPBCC family protein [Marmoricola sp.]